MNTQSSNPNQLRANDGNQDKASTIHAGAERQQQGEQKSAPTRTDESKDNTGSKASEKDATIRPDDQAGKTGTKAPSSN